ncbi:MAG: diguanylate cyclase [Spirochaetes bacterium]|nr:diguanylate cyclase [Spirochaetota bacterium]
MQKKIRVLIVDDDRIIRVAVQRILNRNSNAYSIDEADSRSAMMDMLKKNEYDCIILDYFLRDTEGLHLLEDLKQMKIQTPVIMMTGQGDEMIAVRTLKAGAYDYLPKSILNHNDAAEILIYTIQNTVDKYLASLERSRTAIALRKSEERYRSLVENSPILIMRFFPDDLQLSFVNDSLCNYFGFDRSRLLGESIFETIFKEDNDDVKKTIDSLTSENPVLNLDHYSMTGNGMRWQMWTFQALLDDNSTILEYQCIGEDITLIKTAEKELYKQKVYLQSMLDSQENMIIVTDKKEILEANHGFLIFFGYRNLDEFKKEHTDLIELALDIPDYITNKDHVHWIDSVLNGLYAQPLIAFHPEWRDESRVFSVNINMLSLEHEVYVVTFSDVTQLEEKSKSFEEKATIDALTNIYNKEKFNELLLANVEICRRYNNDLSVFFFDIDHFKRVNDTYGHQTGDFILQDVAAIINGSKRKVDVFARWGGEEFVILLPNTELKNALKVAEKMRKKIYSHKYKDDITISCSFGVTELKDMDSPAGLISRADKALYKAKQSGRNRVVGMKVN